MDAINISADAIFATCKGQAYKKVFCSHPSLLITIFGLSLSLVSCALVTWIDGNWYFTVWSSNSIYITYKFCQNSDFFFTLLT